MAMGSFSARCAILALACGAGFGFSPASARAAESWRHDYVLSDEAQRNEHVALVAVRAGRVFDQVQAMARVDADTSRVIDIHSAGSGKVMAVHVTPGEPVNQGQALISYTDHSLHELQLQREQVQAALDSARAGEAEAELLYKRGLALVGSAVSRGELERRSMVLEQQRGLVTARKADLATLEHRQTEEFTSVTERIVQDEASDLISPVKGVVQAVRTSVAADISAGDNLVTVVDLSRLWLVADLSPEDASGLAPGGAAEFRLAGQKSGVVLSARISTIAGLADPATGLVRVVCVLDHPPVSLRPGMMLDAAFQTGEGTPGLVVPVGALQQIDGEDVVFLRKDPTHFTPVSVQVHAQDDDHAAISGALQDGQSVVEQGSFALKSMALLSSMTAD